MVLVYGNTKIRGGQSFRALLNMRWEQEIRFTFGMTI